MADSYELYLVRHGIAEDRDEWPDDAKRPLTETGAARLQKGAEALVLLGVTFDLVLTSPFLRTRQTAEILAGAFDLRPPIVITESMSPGAAHQAVFADLEKHSRRRRIALVGHETSIGELAARLAGARRAFVFKKGAVCRIDFEMLPPTGPGAVRWFLTPKILRSIGK